MKSMKMKLFCGTGILLTGVLAYAALSHRVARAGESGELVAMGHAALFAADGETDFGYVGSKTCKKCHSATYKAWEKLAHGQALETLKPGAAAEAKTKFNLDPDKDYTTDENCLKCHTTGFGKEGGFTIPDASDKKAVRRAAKLAGVGCESCHGPGDAYNKVFKEIMTSKRMYKVEELTAVGLQPITEQTCSACHNADSPTHDASKPFDFEERKKTGVHEHVELKQREG